MPTTFDPNNINSGGVLSNNNLTFTTSNGFYTNVMSTSSKSSGKWYFEITVNSQGSTTSGGQGALGVGVSQILPTNNNVIGTQSSGSVGIDNFNTSFFNANNQKTTSGGSNIDGQIFAVCLDITNQNVYIWMVGNSSWEGQPSSHENPSSSSGGLNSSLWYNGSMNGNLFGVPLYACVSTFTNSQLTANFGQTPFFYPLPSGFLAWDTPTLGWLRR